MALDISQTPINLESSKFSFKSSCEEIKSQSLEKSSSNKLVENWGIDM